MKTKITVPISHLLSDEERKCIRIFKRKAQDLAKTAVLKKPLRIAISLKGGKDGFASKVDLPREEFLTAFYSAFRFFYLEKEPSNFLRVINIIKKHSKSSLVNQAMDQNELKWSGKISSVKFEACGKKLTTKLILDLWFNAYYFHSDEKKFDELRDIQQILSDDLAKYILASAVYDASQAVLNVAQALETLKT